RLYPKSLAVLKHMQQFGSIGLLSDGDVVFQPHKVHISGLFEAVKGNVLIYIHKEKELKDVQRRFPARHYMLVDDKIRILTAVKKVWGKRVTTVFVRQGHYALDKKLVREYPPADVTIESIGHLLKWDKQRLLQETAPH
ncbi:MAG TPA: HAD family hydrolase, partial [Candidatus Dormibacteraeota bacterium]|nr:HAD family hydrolase [Candidatus Dormibacteraeota bacterium]